MKAIAVSGATGFVGGALVRGLVERGRPVHAFVRSPMQPVAGMPVVATTSLLRPDTWAQTLTCCAAFVHCAALADANHEREPDSALAFQRANVDLTLALARSCVAAGVRRFVFVSSLGVNGDGADRQAYSPADPPRPGSLYASSKHEAEVALMRLAGETGLEVVVVRPPLVHGPGAPRAFGQLVHWLRRGVPLPLGAVVHNRRSIVGIDNLVDLLVTCIDHPAAAGRTFMVSDDEDVSTADLLRRVARAMGLRARLLPVPPALLSMAARLLGRPQLAQKLVGSCRVDMRETVDVLGWCPSVGLDEGLRRAVARDVRKVGAGGGPAAWLRVVDVAFALIGLGALAPVLVILLLVGWFDTRSPLFVQERVGRHQRPFRLVKFRTMALGTAQVATHLASPASVTRYGRFLRRTKLDELPQLWNVLTGDMSLVGPRPCLYNQNELIAEREARAVFAVRPGITGLAQVSGIDMSTPALLAQTDARMLADLTARDYFRYILLTAAGRGAGDRTRPL